jgi:hypothetical protein
MLTETTAPDPFSGKTKDQLIHAMIEDGRLIRDLNRDVAKLRIALNDCWEARHNPDAVAIIIQEAARNVG